MRRLWSPVFAVLGLSVVALAQQDGPYQVGYAAHLDEGDAIVNLSNGGAQGGFMTGRKAGSICVNVYAFDPQEEMIACCSCLVTPNALNSLSAKRDLILANRLTPSISLSIIIKLVATTPAVSAQNTTSCTPHVAAGTPPPGGSGNQLATGLLAWGTTLAPLPMPRTYAPIPVPYLNAALSASEQSDLAAVCSFIQYDGSGFGICGSCRSGALSGQKQ